MPAKSPLAARPVDMQAEMSAYRRQVILREASRLFYERGYQGTTMDDIATHLNVTKPFLYSQFENKAELLYVICQGGMAELLKTIDDLLQLDIGPAAKLREIVAGIATTIIEKQANVAVYFREAKHLTPQQANAIHRKMKEFDRKMEKLLQDGVAAGVFQVRDPALTSLAISGMMSWMFSWYRPQGRLSVEQLREGFVELAARMVVEP